MLNYADLQSNYGLYCARHRHHFLVNHPPEIDYHNRLILGTCKDCDWEAQLKLTPQSFRKALQMIENNQDIIIIIG